MSHATALPNVWIFGDVHIDSAICEIPNRAGAGRKQLRPEDNDPHLLVKHYYSGAWLVAEILSKVFGSKVNVASWKKPTLNFGLEPISEFPQSLYRVTPLTKRAEKNDTKSELVYRIKDSIGWLNAIPAGKTVDFAALVEGTSMETYFGNDLPDPSFVILFDRNDGFRHSVAAQKIIERIRKLNSKRETTPVILWIRSAPFFGKDRGLLGDFLCGEGKDQTVVVVRGECLRRTGITLLQDGSVEQFVESVFSNRSTSIVSELLAFAHSVWYFREATMHFCSSAPDHSSYHFCPYSVDEMWQPRLAGGQMRGYSTIVAASMAISMIQAMRAGSSPMSVLDCTTDQIQLSTIYETDDDAVKQSPVVQGVQLGQVLSTFHYREGYASLEDFKESGDVTPRLDSPIPHLIASYVSPFPGAMTLDKTHRDHRLSSLYFNGSISPQLSRVDAFLEHSSKVTNRTAQDFLINVVTCGLTSVVELPKETKPRVTKLDDLEFPRASVWCPYAQFGSILTADRDEIEAYMSVYSLLYNYFSKADKPDATRRPFSVAVFGAPGSGKNFAIKQLVKCIDPRIAAHALEYNISQFSDVGDLMAVLHHVHDLGSSGIEVPQKW